MLLWYHKSFLISSINTCLSRRKHVTPVSERKSANGLNMLKSLFRHSQLDSVLLLSLSLKPAKSGLGPGILSKGTSFFQHWLQFPFLLQSPWYKSTQPSRISNVQRCESVIVDLKKQKDAWKSKFSPWHIHDKMRKLITFMMLCVAENHKHGTHDRVTCQCTWPYSIASFQPRFINPGPSLHPAENMSCLEKLQLFMTHDHQSGYFVRRINLVFEGTWDSEEIYCKKYCLVFADLDFCNPKIGLCLTIILFHLPSTESTNITNHHVLQYLPLQWRCLA